MDGMPYGLARSTRPTSLGHEPASKIGAAGQTGSLEVTKRLPHDVGAPPAGDMLVFSAGSIGPISHRFAITEVHDGVQLALNPGAAAKVVVTFDA